jgi:predicted DNA-binding protein (MmcQ/YjbR family)
MTGDDLRAHCLARPGATEDFPFGPDVSVFKVAGKMFALAVLDATPLQVSVKCDPAEALALRATYAAVRPGYHLDKRHWNTVDVGADVTDDEVLEMIDESYRLVTAKLPRAQRAALGLAE